MSISRKIIIIAVFFTVNSHEGEGWTRALQEANLATEVGLIVLDAVCTFTIHFKDTLQNEASGELVQQVCKQTMKDFFMTTLFW